MRTSMNRGLDRVRAVLAQMTVAQRSALVLGAVALLIAGFMLVRWVAAPSYTPLFSNLSSKDASAVVDQLDSKGVAYKLTDGGSTVLVPQSDVYKTRISLSGEGLPSSGDSGYSILDKQSLSTSKFKERTDYKRAMEAELAKTVESINGVDTAIVHLAMPEKQVFAAEQDPTTASVLVETKPGATLAPEQVQAVVNLVASSVDGLKPANVTVADQDGTVLSEAGSGTGAGSGGRQQQVTAFQEDMRKRVQTMLDRVLGAGNSTTQVTADLDFDNTTTQTTRYFTLPKATALSSSTSSETYSGGTPSSGSTGVVGPDGQMDSSSSTTTGGNGSYRKSSQTSDQAVDKTVEQREAAPGGVNSLHVGVALDSAKNASISPTQLQDLVSAAIGIDTKRGDTVDVTSMAFDRTAEKAAASELAAADKAAKHAQWMSMGKTAGLLAVIALLIFLAWRRSKQRSEERREATTYLVEQLRQDALDRPPAETAVISNPALAALEQRDDTMTDDMRAEIADLVDRQPDDVAALLRGWLVERHG